MNTPQQIPQSNPFYKNQTGNSQAFDNTDYETSRMYNDGDISFLKLLEKTNTYDRSLSKSKNSNRQVTYSSNTKLPFDQKQVGFLDNIQKEN